MQSQCLERYIPNRSTLERETALWALERNNKDAGIEWLFSIQDARDKFKKAYPSKSL